MGVPPCRLNPKCLAAPVAGTGEGLFAREPLEPGETIVEWTGRVLDGRELLRVDAPLRANSIQIGDDAFLVPERLAPGDRVNHSCAPNAGLRGDRTLVAMRAIAAGEQIGYDYATSDGCDYDEFDCRCGAPGCRGRVSGDDWRRPELQARYRGWFSPYLAARVAALDTP